VAQRKEREIAENKTSFVPKNEVSKRREWILCRFFPSCFIVVSFATILNNYYRLSVTEMPSLKV